jgi:hypothetical protein
MKNSATTAKTTKSTKSTKTTKSTTTSKAKQPKSLNLCHSFGSQLRLKDVVAKAKDGDQFIVNRADEENYGAMFEKWLRYLAGEYGFTVKTVKKYQEYLITVTKK